MITRMIVKFDKNKDDAFQGIAVKKRLEELSGVSQPVIARMERGATSPQVSTLLKVLRPLGLTVKIVPVSEA